MDDSVSRIDDIVCQKSINFYIWCLFIVYYENCAVFSKFAYNGSNLYCVDSYRHHFFFFFSDAQLLHEIKNFLNKFRDVTWLTRSVVFVYHPSSLSDRTLFHHNWYTISRHTFTINKFCFEINKSFSFRIQYE